MDLPCADDQVTHSTVNTLICCCFNSKPSQLILSVASSDNYKNSINIYHMFDISYMPNGNDESLPGGQHTKTEVASDVHGGLTSTPAAVVA